MTDPRRGGATRALDRLGDALMILAGVSLVLMVVVQAWQVFARYVLNDSPGWTEPVALLFMSLVVMFGAALAVRRESHFAFQGVQQALPDRAGRVARIASRLIAALTGLGLLVLGGQLMLDDWPVLMAGVPLPSGLRYLGMVVGGGLILVFSIERLVSGDPAPKDVAEPEAF